MRTIWQAMKDGTAKERLAICADLVSIAGISIASVAGGIFAITHAVGVAPLDLSQIAVASVVGLLSLAGAVLFLAIFLTVLSRLRSWQPQIPGVCLLVISAVWLCVLALVIVAAWVYYDIFSSFRFVRP
ncbi:hypothetical protein [Xanthomonas sacchari]|uniref:hypothetical protein n=1 Tax=Xanthomonas sacchari TaxID=56458 RepID=UPI002259D57F|nr:hypothetical protein [Xanthomonas sacchari]